MPASLLRLSEALRIPLEPEVPVPDADAAHPSVPLEAEPLITLRPRGGLPMRLERRTPVTRTALG